MDQLPTEVWNQILGFLVDDGISIVRLSTCSQSLHQYITTNQFLWKKICKNQWKFPLQTLQQDQDSDSFRLEYQRRHVLDARTRVLLTEMTGDLGDMLEYETGKKVSKDSPLIGENWDHPFWQEILSFRTEIFDFLLDQARSSDKDNQLYKLLAARCLQTIHLKECLYTWTTLMQSAGHYDPKEDALLLERFALLAVQIQQTPRELMEEPNVTDQVCEKLDAIADTCRERFTDDNQMTKLDKLQVVNQILFQEYGLQGNSQDYYNYRNSLLNHVLESKKGIPMTLCIIYTLICRRLDLEVYLVGLPGHVVLGVGDNDYYDLFNGGDDNFLLSVEDCQRICASYNAGWHDEFLRPLQAVDALHRILNNLANCHPHHLRNPPEFHPDVWFQQRALMLLHRTGPHISREEMLGQFFRELPLVLSVDLFRFYNLLD
jgi:regulator of sirC expression with transglutaminase-like and TPR domain